MKRMIEFTGTKEEWLAYREAAKEHGMTFTAYIKKALDELTESLEQ